MSLSAGIIYLFSFSIENPVSMESLIGSSFKEYSSKEKSLLDIGILSILILIPVGPKSDSSWFMY